MKRGELKEQINWAKVIFLPNGEKLELKTRAESVCHFFEEFEVENEKIILRLDWSDRDVHGHPKLDADFYDINTGKKKKLKGELKSAHHTPTLIPGERTYCWTFKDYTKLFQVLIGWRKSISAKVGVKCSIEMKINRNISERS